MSGGPYGGSVNCLALAPSNPDIVYAGTQGGVYKSLDAGSNWSGTAFPPIPVRVIQVAAQDPDVVYAGTDDGVYRSADGGETWTQRGLTGEKIYALVIHPDNADVVFAGNMMWPYVPGPEDVVGIFKSADGGGTWQPKHSSEILGVEALLIDTNDSDVIYAGVRNDSGWVAGLRKSTDGGDTWDGMKVGSSWPWDAVGALTMTPAGHNPPALYAASIYGENVYKSLNQGETWTPTDPPGFSEGAALAVDPRSPNTVYAVANIYYSSTGGPVYRSDNGGDTWAIKKSGLTGSLASSLVVDPRNGNLIAGLQNGGVFKSSNRGDVWAPAMAGMANTYINGLAVQPSADAVVFAAADGYPLKKSANRGADWSDLSPSPSDLGAVAVDPLNPLTIWAGPDFRTASSFYINKSVDGGSTWTAIKFLQASSGSTTTGVTEIIVSTTDSDCVLVGTTYRIGITISGTGVLARTLNGGQSWSQIGGATTALAVDPNNPGLVYQGKARAAQVFAISNFCGGASMQEITPEAGIGDVRDIAVDSDSKVYVAASDGLWRRDGNNWEKLSGLPTTDITAVVIDRGVDPEGIYVGTGEDGVFVSEDGGGTWVAINDGLGNLRVTELVIGSGSTRTIYAGTAYGGVWSAVLGGVIEKPCYLPLVLRK